MGSVARSTDSEESMMDRSPGSVRQGLTQCRTTVVLYMVDLCMGPSGRR